MEEMENMEIIYTDTSESMPFSKERAYNLIMLDVLLNGVRVPMVFDTGGMGTVISESVARQVGTRDTGRTFQASGNAGGSVHGHMDVVECLQIGQSQVLHKNVAVLPDEALHFASEEDGNPVQISGLLGWDIIQHFRWIIDLRKNILCLEQSSGQPSEPNMAWDTMPLIRMTFDGQSLYFGFDSGNTETVLGQQMLPLVGKTKEKTDTSMGVDGILEEKVQVADHLELTIGRQVIRLENIPIVHRDVFPTKNVKAMGLLAVDILQGRMFMIDFPNLHFEILE